MQWEKLIGIFICEKPKRFSPFSEIDILKITENMMNMQIKKLYQLKKPSPWFGWCDDISSRFGWWDGISKNLPSL